MYCNNNGFTLIEILVALFIFAIIGTFAAMSLDSIIVSHAALKKVDQELSGLQMAMVLLRNDTRQIIDRPIQTAEGVREPGLIGSGGDEIEFTRTGVYDPLDTIQQSNMQRVAYTVQNQNFVRLTWDTLDRPPNDTPEVKILIPHVQSISWKFIARNNKVSSSWPPSTGSNMQTESQSDFPKAILMIIHITNKGVVEGTFPVPARGNNAHNKLQSGD